MKLSLFAALLVFGCSVSLHAQCCSQRDCKSDVCDSDRAAAVRSYRDLQKAQRQQAQRLPKKLEKNESNPIVQAVYSAIEGTRDPIRTAAAAFLDTCDETAQITVECRIMTGFPEKFAPQGFTPENGWRFVPKPNKSRYTWQISEPGKPQIADTQLENTSQTIGAELLTKIHTPTLFRFVDDSKARELFDHCQFDSRTNILQAPKLTLFDGQYGCLRDSSERPFVTGIAENGTDPIIEVFKEGIEISLSPELQSDGSIRLKCCNISVQKIEKIEMFPLVPGKEDEKNVQIPQTITHSVDMPITIPKGKSLLVAIPGTLCEVKGRQEEGFVRSLSRNALALVGLKPSKEPPTQREKTMLCVMITPKKIEIEPEASPEKSNQRKIEDEWKQIWGI